MKKLYIVTNQCYTNKKTTKKKHLTIIKIQKQERNKRQGKGRSESIVMELIFDSVICKRKGPLRVAGLQG